MVKNLPYNAGDMGSMSGWGSKFPHAEWQLRLLAETTEPVICNKVPMCHN